MAEAGGEDCCEAAVEGGALRDVHAARRLQKSSHQLANLKANGEGGLRRGSRAKRCPPQPTILLWGRTTNFL